MEGIELVEHVFIPSIPQNNLVSPLKKLKPEERESVFESEQEEAFVVQDHFDRLKIGEWSSTLLAVFGFVCTFVIYDVAYVSPSSPILDFLFAMCTMSTLLLVLSITWRNQLEFVWERGKGMHAQHQNLISSGKYKQLLLEIAINIAHPLWFLNGYTFDYYAEPVDVTVEYSYNSILAFMMLFRIYQPIRLLTIITYYRSSRAQRVCQMSGTYSGNTFALKCLMKERPLTVVILMMVGAILAGGYSIRILERPISHALGKDFSDFGNCMWLIILTMTTVGYGDYYPVTLMGRLCVIIVCFWGVIVVSLMVITLSNSLELEPGETNSLLLFKRLQFKEELRVEAARVIAEVIRYHRIKKTDGDNAKKLKEQVGNIKIRVNNFHRLKLQQRVLYGLDSEIDRIERKMVSLVEGSETNEKLIDRAAELVEELKQEIQV